MRWNVLWVVVFLGSSFGVFGACQQRSREVPKVAFVVPQTGEFSVIGSWFLMGVDLAQAMYPDMDRVVQVRVYDDGSKVEKAVNAYKRAVDVDQARIVVTTLSPVSLSLKSLAIEDSVLLFANAAHPGITDPPHPLIFRYSNTVPQETSLLLRTIDRMSLLKDGGRVAILYYQNDFGQAFYEHLREGLERNSRVEAKGFAYGSGSDLRSVVVKGLSFRPNLVVLIGFTQEAGLLIRYVREQGYEGTIVGNVGLATKKIQEVAGDAFDDVVYLEYAYEVPDTLREVIGKLEGKYGVEFSPIVYLSFDVLGILREVLKRDPSLGKDPYRLSSALRFLWGV